MESLPLHPAVVHVPLGLALVVPLIAGGIWYANRRGWLPIRAWGVVVVLQAAIFAAGLVALNTGEGDEERVERVVAESRIERHEERAELFMVGAGVALALGTLALVPLGARKQEVIAGGSVLASTVVLGLGLWLGHSGGELVYRDGAANAYVSPGAASLARGDHHDDD